MADKGERETMPSTSPQEVSNEERKDIIGCLPIEISQKILQLLSVNDLYNCMEVSKRWQLITNDNEIWEQQCSLFAPRDIIKKIRRGEDYYTNAITGLGGPYGPEPGVRACLLGRRCAGHTDLEASLIRKHEHLGILKCKLAEEYESMRSKFLSRWILGCFRGCTIDMGTERFPYLRAEVLNSSWSRDGSIGYVCGRDFHIVFHGAYADHPRFISIGDGLDFHAPDSVGVCNTYLALSRGRFVRVMKRGQTCYTLLKFFEFTGNTIRLYDKVPKTTGYPCLRIAFITNKYIWLHTSSHIYVVTLSTNKCEIVFSTSHMKPRIQDTGDSVFVWTDCYLGLFMVSGYNVFRNEQSGNQYIKDAACHRYIVVFRKDNYSCGEIQAFHPSNGTMINIRHVCEMDVKLHTHERIVYILQVGETQSYRMLMAIDICSKTVLWTSNLPFHMNLKKIIMKTICDELLFCHIPTAHTSRIQIFQADGRECESHYLPTEAFGAKFQGFSETSVTFVCRRCLLLYAYTQW